MLQKCSAPVRFRNQPARYDGKMAERSWAAVGKGVGILENIGFP